MSMVLVDRVKGFSALYNYGSIAILNLLSQNGQIGGSGKLFQIVSFTVISCVPVLISCIAEKNGCEPNVHACVYTFICSKIPFGLQ